LNTQLLPATLPQTGIDTGFDAFLYAQIGEEANGMQLSVLSALARQNVDPWEFARQLTTLQREPAIQILAARLAHLPERSNGGATAEGIAAQLVALLPSQHRSAEKSGHRHVEPDEIQPVAVIGRIQLIVAIALFMLISQLLLAGLYANAPADKPVSPAVSAPSAIR
jgi:hypothetical protein